MQTKKTGLEYPPGAVGDVAKFIFAQSPRPVKEIAIAGAIGLLAGIVGRAYNVSGTGLNAYVLLLAQTGTGKEAIASGVDTLIDAIGKRNPNASEYIGPGEIHSAQSIVKYMSSCNPSCVSLVGEFGLHLKSMSKPNAAPNLIGLRRFMLDAYNKSGSGKVLRLSPYADRGKNNDDIQSPAFSIVGESEPGSFWKALTGDVVSEGMLPRFTIIEYAGDRKPLNKDHHSIKPGEDLIDLMSMLCSHSTMLNSHDKVINVGQDPVASVMFDEFDVYCDNKINHATDDIYRHMWNRAHIKALKLAAIVAVGVDPYEPVIDQDIAEWSINISIDDAKLVTERLCSKEDEDIQAEQESKVIDIVKDYVTMPLSYAIKYLDTGMHKMHGEQVIPYSYMQRRLINMKPFKGDPAGSTNAIKRAIEGLCKKGFLLREDKAKSFERFGSLALAYSVNKLQTSIDN